MITSNLQSFFTDSKPVRKSTVRVEVSMKPSVLLKAESAEILRELQRLAPYSGYKDVVDLEEEDILRYLNSLVWMRCHRVSGAQDKAYQPYRPLYNSLEVPVLPYQLLIAMGEAYDASFAITFIPEYQIASEDLLAPEELLNLSSIFRSMRTIGFKSVTGLPNDVSGELDFMAMSHVDSEVTSYRESHPVYGFLASFFAQQQLNAITGSMSRMVYGYDSDYRVEISAIHNSMTMTPTTEVSHDA